ncbi:MAG TPA: hypothetical protein VEC37_02580, partial [Bacillota bacterium]|nr:hypothetical protein [Bacillota bacterium]
LFFSPQLMQQLSNNFSSFVNTVIIQKADAPWNSIPAYGHSYLFSLPFVGIGLIFLLYKIFLSAGKLGSNDEALTKQTGQTPDFFLMLLWLLISFLSGLVINNVNINRVNIVFYPLIILAGVGIQAVIQRLKSVSLIIILIYALAFWGFSTSYFGDYSRQLGVLFYQGFGEALESVEDVEVDRVYVTNWTQSENSGWVSEPLTLFHHQIDSLYYQGKADAHFKSGKKKLPYGERYKYVTMNTIPVDPYENAVYIVRNEELCYFDLSKFKIKQFTYYNVVTPLKRRLQK